MCEDVTIDIMIAMKIGKSITNTSIFVNSLVARLLFILSLTGAFITVMLAFGYRAAKLKCCRLKGAACSAEIPFTQMDRKPVVTNPNINWNLYFCNEDVSGHFNRSERFIRIRLPSVTVSNFALYPIWVL